MLAVAIGVVGALLISTNSELDAERAATAGLRDTNGDLQSRIDTYQSAEASRAAAAADVPDLKSVATKYFAGITTVSGDADSVGLTLTGYTVTRGGPALSKMLDELGFSSAVLDRMNNTRALDGTREAQGHNCNVTWTYHPDDGLQMVFEAVPAT